MFGYNFSCCFFSPLVLSHIQFYDGSETDAKAREKDTIRAVSGARTGSWGLGLVLGLGLGLGLASVIKRA